MISVDTVYQKVLSIVNKENRGYITPQEFNLFADQSQLEIFEQYVFDLNQYMRLKENNTEYANLYKTIDEKLSRFKTEADLTYTTDHFHLPDNLHKLGTVIYNGIEVDKVDKKQLLEYQLSKLTQPTITSPVFTQNIANPSDHTNHPDFPNNFHELGTVTYNGADLSYMWVIKVFPSTITSNVSCTYVRKPISPNWGYTSISGNALYNASYSTDFELHESDETALVLKILAYAGLNIKDASVVQVADGKENKKITQEKS